MVIKYLLSIVYKKGLLMEKKLERRQFIKTTAGVGAGLLILPRTRLFGADAPSNKLNIALIGAWGRAKAHFDAIKKENIVALCDIDERHLALAAKEFPRAKHYVDWRKCLEQKDIDAVICCTTDHTHAFVANWAMNRGMHIYCEKPLGNTVEETRLVRETYIKNKNKLATQVGTQRHAKENFNRVRELIKDGVIGELQSVYAWGNRQLRRSGYPPAKGTPPKELHFDLWLGPAPVHPYTPEYFSGKPGANCLQWNVYWDFGTGQVGDMGSHTMDLAWNALDADLPNEANGEGEPFNPEVAPVELHTSFSIPANNWRKAVDVHWYQGGMLPRSPRPYVDLKRIGHGVMFKGSKGFLVADFDSRIIIPYGKGADLTYYNSRSSDELIPPMGHFQDEWINACKGDLKTSCDFDYGGKLIETMLLGLVAYRTGKKLNYDPATARVTNHDEANQYISKEYRPGWTLNG